MIRNTLLYLGLLSCCSLTNAAESNLKLLFLGDQKNHQPATRFEILQPVMAEKGIELTYTEDVASLNRKTLSQYDGLILYANIDSIDPDQAKALLEYVASGQGFIPIHSATYCFRNSPEIVALMGAQFRQHGRGEITTQSAGVQHPITDGYQTFTSWDETYVHHKHNQTDRIVLEYRVGDLQAKGNTREPWTWTRTHGNGRVFYTAWGHDERTWNQPGFQDLIERGIRWACDAGKDAGQVAALTKSLGKQTELPTDLKPFDYIDVGPEIPNYNADRSQGRLGQAISMMQQPAPAKESMKHVVTPEGFHVELFADESMLNETMFGGKPIAMNWDARGRLWVCETVDYPNELKKGGKGRDRVRVIEDTDQDGVADKSTVFAEDLSIPTAVAFHRGGVVVQNGTETLYMKDTDGDGKADIREVLISDWTLIDTHGGVSNFRNGLDNWIWAMQGYNDSAPVINGQKQPKFRMGFFRFKLSQDDHPKVEQLEFVRSTTNNTWGLGISEEGLIFGSTANRQPSFFMPIANRYYERVKGWSPDQLAMICPTHLFDPITDKIRQVDHHGGYTAAAGHALYTARNYPQAWWNRTAFVCGPTGKLVGTFVIDREGAGMKSSSPINLFASDDEWTAPIMAEVGPDGNVWVLDWYNFIVQHNPTPQGFETGKGRAYETKLRDKKYGRIYRVVPDTKPSFAPRKQRPTQDATQLSRSGRRPLVDALQDPTMQVRLHAQRLLVERGDNDIVPDLITLLQDKSVDAIGLNVAAIHALHTLHGLGQLSSVDSPAIAAVRNALSHPSAGVRLNAIRVLPETQGTFDAIEKAGSLSDEDAQVVLAALLKMSDTQDAEAGPAIGPVLSQAVVNPAIANDRWLTDAMTSAAAMHADRFLTSILASNDAMPESSVGVTARVAEHFARSRPSDVAVSNLIAAMSNGSPDRVSPIIDGLSAGWPKDYSITLDESQANALRKVFASVSNRGQASLARLAVSWNNQSLQNEIAPIVASFIDRIEDTDLEVGQRLAAAKELIELDPGRLETAETIAGLIGPQSPGSLSVGLIQAMSQTKAPGLADRYLEINETATPGLREALVRVMMSRPELTHSLMSALESGEITISDLTVEQRGRLSSHVAIDIRRKANEIFSKGGVAVINDRTKLVSAKMPLTKQLGDVQLGKAVFTKNCATCHIFKGEGNLVGPNLNGMSVHPKSELLTHILDPNRSVEANYRLYSVLTVDGVVISGLLSAESLTTIEMVDAQGKRSTILREDIEELIPSKKSAMPEGFEQSIDDKGLVDLLEYLTQSERFIPLGLDSVATATSATGMFYDREATRERLRLNQYGVVTVADVPFTVIDPMDGAKNNVVMLHGPKGPFAPNMPTSVSLSCKTAASKIHLLGGIAGWASRTAGNHGVSMIVRLNYADGKTEDHPLVNGQHISDYNGRFDVPKSKFALETLDGGQIRYLAITPRRDAVIDNIELVKPGHPTAPVVVAVTIELPGHHMPSEEAAVEDNAAKYGDKPNVLFIAIDDLNDHVDHLQGYPGKMITPNLDRLAAMGTTFTNSHCAAPICNTSRTSTMFGVRASTSGVYYNHHRYRESPVLRDALTLPQYLRTQHGYSATGAGKIFHALEWEDGQSDGYSDPASWDSYWPTMQRQMPRRVLPDNIPLARGTGGDTGKNRIPYRFMDWGPIGHPSEAMPDHKVTDWTIEQLSRSHDKPFFLACGIFRPHIPWFVPQEYFDLYPLDEIQVPATPEDWLQQLPAAIRHDAHAGAVRRKWHTWIKESGEWKKAIQGYLASVTYADAQVGRLLDAFENSAHKDNTVVVLWSDHGAHLGDKATWEKYSLWHESTRVPLIFVAPGVTKPGSICKQPASLLDIFPTILELLDLPKPGNQLDGTSLVPQLKDPAMAKAPVVCTHGNNNHAVISAMHRYIRYSHGAEELYDFTRDQGEWSNLAGTPEAQKTISELAKHLPTVNNDFFPPKTGGK
jgi:putative membrane-bound dehydrogenase-like protein